MLHFNLKLSCYPGKNKFMMENYSGEMAKYISFNALAIN